MPKKSPIGMTMNPGDAFNGWVAPDETLYERMRPEVAGVTSGYNPK